MTFKTILMSAAALGAVALPATANAAITIDIFQSGSDVKLEASGSFDSALATPSSTTPISSFGRYLFGEANFFGFGTQGSVLTFNLNSSPFFSGATGVVGYSETSGTSIGINRSAGIFFISSSYADNSSISSSALVTGQSLGSLNLITGVYNFAVGDNALTLNIGQTTAAVPEPATWAMFLLGFGAVGYSMRRRKGTTAQVSFA